MTKLVATGVEFPDATIQTTLVTDIGVGQTWQAFASPARVTGTTYTNSSGKSISLSITTQGAGYITVQGVISAFSAINDAVNHLNTIVPNGAAYFMTGAAYDWRELRS
jgi:hypothetical protein